MKCPKCGATDYIHIEIHLSGEDTVQFFSCRACETKWWEKEGDAIALDDVLNIASKK